MQEEFEIQDRDGHHMVYCRKRNLEILVTERFDIPAYPEHFQLVFARIDWQNHPPVRHLKDDVIVCFGVCDYDQIEYEPYFKHLLVSNAIGEYMAQQWCLAADELIYSPAYQKNFIDSMSLDPDQMTPELLAYVSRDPAEEPLDFYTWKEKYLKPFLN
ncbi:hypothetical protein [Mucilaginibacter terrae]|uniref:Uncharacterized protein n=1 Tax=Mucilaginibacter terrae TaxID=1955052 RepID=A0ABU3GNA1_9SPHI|nr:hypothetical protein [Mucilaginibacter terrae]MDT3401021.1 hypothetical protein [Mucilaginibacter terrae]